MERLPVILIVAVRHLKPDVCAIEEIVPDIHAQVGLVTDNCAMEIVLPHVVWIFDVMEAGFGQIIGMDYD